MAKKLALVGILFLLLAVAAFMMMRRSQMLSAGSQGSDGGLKAVNPQGTPIPAPASAGGQPQNSAVQTSGDLFIALSVNPYPPSGNGPTEFAVILSDASGQPVSDAAVSLDLTMPQMWMPPNQLNLTASGAGKYQASGFFTMRGLWRMEVIIVRGGQKQSVLFDVGL